MIPKLLKITGTYLNSFKQRVVKMIASKATYTAEEYSPYGVDSNPINGMTAIYLRTESDGDECIIGYLQKDRLSAVGENRIFSTDENGAIKTFIWLKNDGIMQLGGDSNFAVRFNELATEFNKLKSSYNDLVTKFNAHTHLYAPGPGTPVVTATTTTPGVSNTSNINNARNDKIKTI